MELIQTFPFKPQCSGGNSFASTPDGFFFLGGRSVNFVKPSEKPLIKAFNTKQQITAIDVDPYWSTDEKLFATLTSEKSILIWDFNKGIAISGHKAHCHMQSEGAERSNSSVHMGFLKNRNLLSLDSNDLVVYCVASNSLCVRPKFAPGKGHILTALKCSPYKEHIFGLGTNRGQIYICDLQKMTIVFTLGRHQSPVVSLSWVQIDKMAKAHKTTKPPLLMNRAMVEENDDIFNIYDYDYLENEFGAPIKNDKSKDVEAVDTMANEVTLNPNFNYQEACESLRQEIHAMNNSNADDVDTRFDECDAVTLDDCRSSKNVACLSSMGNSESTEGSLEFVDRSSSSDENRHVDGRELEDKKLSSESEGKTKGEECEAKALNSEKVTGAAGGASDGDVNGEEQNDILLASSSSDCQIYLWNARTGGCCDNIKCVSRKSSKGSNVSVHIMWRNSSELYAIDNQGEIIRWELLPKNSKGSYKFERLPSDYSEKKALAFGLCRDLNLLWYISAKHEIVCEIIDGETILQYATAATGIMTARESPDNNSKIALAYGDRRIALLDTSELSLNKTVIRYLAVKLNTFVRTLAWNHDGSHIAYGTNEGQVGYVNVDTQKHVTFHTIYGKPVYSIAWRKEIIFTTCNDKLLAYKTGKRESLTVQGIKDSVSTLSVHQDYLFMGTTRGYIDIYREDDETPSMPDSKILSFKLIKSVEVAKKYITEIAWNPLKHNEFAVVSNEAYINVLAFNANENAANLIRRIEFGKPKATVSSIKWSNRNPEQFVTSGLDGVLRIFDLGRPSNEELIFVKQFHCPLYSAMLLPTNEMYVLCTGRSITIEIVDTRSLDDQTTSTSKKDGTLDSIKWAAKMSIGNSMSGSKKKDKSTGKSKSQNLGTHLENTAAATDLTEKIAELAIDKSQIKTDIQNVKCKSDLRVPQTLMSLIAKEHNKNPLCVLRKFLTSSSTEGKEKETILVAQLFHNRKDAEKVLNAELAMLKTQTTIAELGEIFMSQVKGDVKNVIVNAIQTRQLKEWHIALAPTVSFGFWQNCCHAFAEQLLEQGYALQAATYMLAQHNQREAINMLIEGKFFKEALLIGRIYLPENDPLIDEITNKWIDQLENHGNLPGAALICAVSHQYMRGYEILSKQRVIGPEETCVINLLKEKGSALA